MEYNIDEILADIFMQAQKGRVEIGAGEDRWVYFLKFFVQTPTHKVENADGIILNIPNWSEFVKEVENYLKASKNFYAQDQSYMELDNYSFLQKRIVDLLINVSPSDCENMNKYVQTRTKMYKSKDFSGMQHFGTFKNMDICASITKNQQSRASFEAPYAFTPFMADDQGSAFVLPSVIYGIADDKIHLMAIQNLQKDKQTFDFAKKADRLLRKVNSGFDAKTLSPEDQDLANVSPNALVSLSIFAQFMQDNGFTKVVAPSYLPIRYSNKTENINQKYRFTQIDSALERVDDIQYNMTNKLINTLFRFSRHFPSTTCEYDDQFMATYLNIDTAKPTDKENIIYDITQAVQNPSQLEE